jgi:hypothetical protein
VLVVSNRNKPFRIVKCTYDEKVINIKQETVPEGNGYTLEVTPNMKNIPPGGRIQTTLTIETDVAAEGKHEVQVQLLNLADVPK